MLIEKIKNSKMYDIQEIQKAITYDIKKNNTIFNYKNIMLHNDSVLNK